MRISCFLQQTPRNVIFTSENPDGIPSGGTPLSLFTTVSRSALGPTCILSNWYPGLFPQEYSGRGDKLTNRAVVKNAWSYTIAPTFVSKDRCLIMHGDNFTLLPLLPTQTVAIASKAMCKFCSKVAGCGSNSYS
jgi:hypothetical protein